MRYDFDVFDTSTHGQNTWKTLKQTYEQYLQQIEDQIIRLLEDKLNSSKTTEEMFQIFKIFNPLFFRSSIRNAVNSFRVVLGDLSMCIHVLVSLSIFLSSNRPN